MSYFRPKPEIQDESGNLPSLQISFWYSYKGCFSYLGHILNKKDVNPPPYFPIENRQYFHAYRGLQNTGDEETE